MPSAANRNLYNGGSEWQDDFANLPDLKQTFYRMYDAALGRFTAVDPMAEATDSYGTYHYAMDNPVMFNDPMGDTAPKYTVLDVVASIMSDPRGKANGGYWSSKDPEMAYFFENAWDAFGYTTDVIDLDNGGGGGWGGAFTEDYNTAYKNFVEGKAATPEQRGAALRQVDIKETKTNPNWLVDRQKEAFGSIFGTTLTMETAFSNGNSDSFMGKYLLEFKYTQYTGVTNDKVKGIFNFNTTIRNADVGHDVSVDIGKFSYSMGLTSRSISYNGYSFNFDASIIDGITYGISYGNNGNISGSEITINPFKIIPAVAIAAYHTAPYWLPVLAL